MFVVTGNKLPVICTPGLQSVNLICFDLPAAVCYYALMRHLIAGKRLAAFNVAFEKLPSSVFSIHSAVCYRYTTAVGVDGIRTRATLLL
jgi:hypothetical protein